MFLKREKDIQLLFVQLYSNVSYFNFAPDEAQGKDAQWPRLSLFVYSPLALVLPVCSKPGLATKGAKDAASCVLCTAPVSVFTSYNTKCESVIK